MTTKTADPSGAKDTPCPVPPDAVRVWRGYRLPSVTQAEFFQKLGDAFIPVTVSLQRLYGLTAYLPSVLPTDKPDGVPDEIALVFYRSKDVYQGTKTYPAGRAYQYLHATVFDLGKSHSDFPAPFSGTLTVDKPYHLFTEAIDWQGGFAQVLVGARPSGVDANRFAEGLSAFYAGLQAKRPEGLDGAIVWALDGYVLHWEHWTSRKAAEASRIGALGEIALPVIVSPFTQTAVEPRLDKPSPGVPVGGGECFNTQFPRVDPNT